MVIYVCISYIRQFGVRWRRRGSSGLKSGMFARTYTYYIHTYSLSLSIYIYIYTHNYTEYSQQTKGDDRQGHDPQLQPDVRALPGEAPPRGVI